MTAIKFENISKQYRLGLVSTNTLSHDLNRWWQTSIRGKDDPYLKIGDVNDRSTKAESDYVWALKDINFEVQQGDVLGIIGKNGSGKSTLLKILSKITAPTTGTIQHAGRIAALLEVGTGFHPEMTGRENIYLNGAILGMSKSEIKGKLDEIIDFSGIERYIDTPSKRYSSGMYVRLGFAIAAHLDPEIMIVDEVLAVGDAEFQKKAIGKMQDISNGEGRTVLFVSHNMAAVKQLCSKGLLLNNGCVESIGEVSNIISKYLISDSSANSTWKRNKMSLSKMYFNEIKVLNSRKIVTSTIESEEDFEIFINLTSSIINEDATIAIKFENEEGIPIFTTSLHDSLKINQGISKGTFDITAVISKNILIPGKYKLTIACFISRIILYDLVDDIKISIEDLGITKKDKDRQGYVIPNYDWEIN